MKKAQNTQEFKEIMLGMDWETRLKGCTKWVKSGIDEPAMYMMTRLQMDLYEMTPELHKKMLTVQERLRNLSFEEIFQMWAQQENLAPEIMSDMQKENLDFWVNQEYNKLSGYSGYLGDLDYTAVFLVMSQYVDVSKPCKRSRLALHETLANSALSTDTNFRFFLYLHSSANISDTFDLQGKLGIPDGCEKLDIHF